MGPDLTSLGRCDKSPSPPTSYAPLSREAVGEPSTAAAAAATNPTPKSTVIPLRRLLG